MQVAGAVGGEDDDRAGASPCSVPSSGIVTRRLGEQLEQERLELVVGAVDLVDEQHRRPRARVLERREQRPLRPGSRGRTGRLGERPRRAPRRAGCRAAGAGSSTRRAPRRRRCPRSTAAGSAGCRAASASALAASVLPTPASPSSSSGCGRRDGAEQRRRQRRVGEVAHVGEPAHERRGVGDQRSSRLTSVAYVAGSATYAGGSPGRRTTRRSPSTSANSASSDDRDGHAAHRVDRGLRLEPMTPGRVTGGSVDRCAGPRGGAAARAGARAPSARTRDSAISCGVRAPMSSPAGCGRAPSPASSSSSEATTASPRLRARDQPDVRHAAAQRRRERRLLVAAVRWPPRRRRRRSGRRRVVRRCLVAERALRDVGQRAGDRGVAEHRHQRQPGATGSRKISSVPPDRHGLCDHDVLPGWSRLGRRA